MKRLLPSRLLAALVHLGISGLVTAVAAAIVFLLLYPSPFSTMAGGFELFFLVVGVDLAMGPLLTLVVFNPRKPRGELVRDLGIIGLLQLAALLYGLHAVSEGRPVALAFEVDRFRLVSAAEVQVEQLAEAPEGHRSLSLTGPRLVAAIKPLDPDEQLRAIEVGMQGIDLGMQPRYWRPYEAHASEALRRARPAELLIRRDENLATQIEQFAASAGVPASQLVFLPFVSRKASWVILLEPAHGQPVGYLPVDGFF
jgi:hypothetical protein